MQISANLEISKTFSAEKEDRMCLWFWKSASIQLRTSPSKFGGNFFNIIHSCPYSLTSSPLGEVLEGRLHGKSRRYGGKESLIEVQLSWVIARLWAMLEKEVAHAHGHGPHVLRKLRQLDRQHSGSASARSKLNWKFKKPILKIKQYDPKN